MQIVLSNADNLKMKEEKIRESIDHFLQWKRQNGYFSYDQYDFWNTKYGIWSKKLYYRNKKLGALFVAPVFVTELLLPSARKLFVTKKRFPIADAHFIMGHLNLYQITNNENHLKEAEDIASELLKISIPGFSGECWGYPFEWMTTRGLWKSGTPLMTTTVYCFEAFLNLYDVTKKSNYLEIANSILQFTLRDIKDHRIDNNTAVSSYSPFDNSQIINSNAYRSFVLVEGYHRFNNDEALEKARLNINFILKSQREDGSWLYAINDERDNFVDNFHTCFVLKNLLKVNAILKDEAISKAIKRGFEFYKVNLLNKDYSPKPFSKLSRVNIVKKELYDFAEGISLCLQMQHFDNKAREIAEKLLTEVIKRYQKKDGSFYTRINILNIPNKISYLRWSQSQLFYSLSNYLLNNKKPN
jgi:rhamnogalacturonyl hydrolase YesR